MVETHGETTPAAALAGRSRLAGRRRRAIPQPFARRDRDQGLACRRRDPVGLRPGATLPDSDRAAGAGRDVKARSEWTPAHGGVPSDSDSASGLGAAITKAASRQTFYTIRFLVDRPRVADAYRAYGYFRWVDDRLDGGPAPSASSGDAGRIDRLAFLARQQELAAACLRGDPPDAADPHEMMLVELLRHSGSGDSELRSYVEQMMRVMAFDVRRRGRLITALELDEYTRSLAIAVTDAMHHFIGHGSPVPDDADRYRAVTGAHILHMLRDTEADLQAGYFNVPLEVLEASSIGPRDVHCDAYRRWVRERVLQADRDLRAGERYFVRLRSRRHRLAGLAYIERFRWLVERLERDDYRIPRLDTGSIGRSARLRAAWSVIAGMAVRSESVPAAREPVREMGSRS